MSGQPLSGLHGVSADQPYDAANDINVASGPEPGPHPPAPLPSFVSAPTSESPLASLDTFQPAFARQPSHSPSRSLQSVQDPGSSRPTSTAPRLYLPELGDPRMMGELPSTDPLSTLLNKHLPAHLRPPRDLSGSWTHHASSTATPSSTYPDPFASAGPTQIDAEAVQEAVRTNSWRRIAILARSKIQQYGSAQHDQPGRRSHSDDVPDTLAQMSTVDVLQWWSVRLYALARLRLYSLMRTEMVSLWSLLDNVDIATDAEPGAVELEGGRVGGSETLAIGGSPQRRRDARSPARVARKTLAESSLVPFSLRVLRAREPRYRGELRSAIDASVELLAYCRAWAKKWRRTARKLAKGEAGSHDAARRSLVVEMATQEAVWKDRADRLVLMVAAMLAEVKDYPSAIAILTPLVNDTISAAHRTPTHQHATLLSHIARLYIQAGSLSTAASLVSSAQRICDRLLSETKTEDGEASEGPRYGNGEALSRLTLQNDALLATTRGEYDVAEAKFRRLAETLPSGQDGTAAEEGVVWTGLAVSTFYQGKLQEPVDWLERLLSTSPSSVTSVDPFVFNLCTLHELRSDDSLSDKRRILKLVGQWAGEGCGTGCLKLA